MSTERTYCAGVLEAMQRFEEAVRADEMKGAGHPEDIDDIEEEYKEAKDALEDILSQVE